MRRDELVIDQGQERGSPGCPPFAGVSCEREACGHEAVRAKEPGAALKAVRGALQGACVGGSQRSMHLAGEPGRVGEMVANEGLSRARNVPRHLVERVEASAVEHRL